jgi:hypothetical protein
VYEGSTGKWGVRGRLSQLSPATGGTGADWELAGHFQWCCGWPATWLSHPRIRFSFPTSAKLGTEVSFQKTVPQEMPTCQPSFGLLNNCGGNVHGMA